MKRNVMKVKNKNLRRLSITVTAQTAYNLEKLRKICGYKYTGKVVDKLVREKMIEMKGSFKDEWIS